MAEQIRFETEDAFRLMMQLMRIEDDLDALTLRLLTIYRYSALPDIFKEELRYFCSQMKNTAQWANDIRFALRLCSEVFLNCENSVKQSVQSTLDIYIPISNQPSLRM